MTVAVAGLSWKRRLRRLLSNAIRPVQVRFGQRRRLWRDAKVLRKPASPHGEKVLIIRMDALGDFVVWLDAAEFLIEYYRRAGKTVTLLASPSWSQWARELSLFDEVIDADRGRFRDDPVYRRELAARIRAIGFGTVVVPGSARTVDVEDALARISGSNETIGGSAGAYKAFSLDQSVSDGWYTRKIPIADGLRSELERGAAFVRGLTGEPYKLKSSDLRSRVGQQLPRDFSAVIGDSPFYILFPGASWTGRMWPIEHFARIAERLTDQTHWTGVICGGPGEEALAETMMTQCKVPLVNWVARTNLSEFASIVMKAKLLMANETSAIHFASALRTPSICILGGGHFGRFVPYVVEDEAGECLPHYVAKRMDCYGCDWFCKYHPPAGSPVPCINEISVEHAWNSVQRLLTQSSTALFPIID